MTTICGIDDAGRGPVIGPMVIAGIVIDEKDLPKLKELGVKDSKLLTPKQREQIYTKLIKEVKRYKIIKIPPEEVDKYVFSETTNLNWLEADKMAEVINTLRPDQVIVDCPSNNKRAFADYLENKLTVKTSLRCEHKADRDFEIVGAASILAKVTRDREVDLLKKKFGMSLGSGYPADPDTKRFLKDNWNVHPEIFRHSWSSYQEYSEGKKSKKQKTLGEF